MIKTTDEELAAAAMKRRSETLRGLYVEASQTAKCTCAGLHSSDNPECPKAIWEQAARMAALMET